MTLPDPTQRFSTRVQDYIRYRPGYPDAIVLVLREEFGLDADAPIADVGSGTGISSELFLRHGFRVYGVEPNREMREAAEAWLAAHPRFHSVPGAAEATGLEGGSIDLVVAGQAFHWFDRGRARREFTRILRPDSPRMALFWNSRRTDASPFLRAYEDLLQSFATDYREVNHRNTTPAALEEFFGGEYRTRIFPNGQSFDYEGLEGRLLSSSYAPAAGHPRHEAMLGALREIFTAHQEDGRVRFLYDAELFYGLLA